MHYTQSNSCVPNEYYCAILIVTSFLEVGPILLEDQSVQFLLTERFSQDAVESYFGDQRSRGHRNTNPNIQQFTANILRVSTGLSRKERGNVRGRKRDATTTSTPTLRKRVQKRKT